MKYPYGNIRDEIALFSGRFDPPNLGHVITIEKLLCRFKTVIVCALNYKERSGCDVLTALEIFKMHFSMVTLVPKVILMYNNTHFGVITVEEITGIVFEAVNEENLENIVYVGGNVEVNEHIKNIGIKVEPVARVPLYDSTGIRKRISNGETLDEIYDMSGLSVNRNEPENK